MSTTTRTNNFDLLRLLAALQVVHGHAVHHLNVQYGAVGQRVSDMLALFPGVPIFFVISGFLISMSYERSTSLTVYARNRLLRIYPGLWACFGVSLLLLGVFGMLSPAWIGTPGYWGWIAGQITFVQFFNPDALRTFGVGVLNGSLWTIPVELQFYLALPLLYRFGLDAKSRWTRTAAMSVMAALSFAVWCVWQHRISAGGADTASKLVQVTLAPHLFMFLAGVALQRNWERVASIVEGRAAWWVAAYLAERLVERMLLGTPSAVAASANVASVVASALSFGLLAMAVMSIAYTKRTASRVLRGHDISYGVYIYHMLVINTFRHLALTGSAILIPAVVAIAIVVASVSWIYIERPVLNLKRKAVRGDWQPNMAPAV
jgi:peptidoglycan/LPS O-acetylase OafA/YrhL